MSNKFDVLTKEPAPPVRRRSVFKRLGLRLALLALGSAALCINTSLQAGDQVPFKGRFNFVVVSATPLDPTHILFHVDVDVHGTQLGKASGPGMFIFDVAALSYAGEATWMAANGDLIYSSFEGHFVPTAEQGVLGNVESFEITGGTGRFEDATGGGNATGKVDAATLLPLGPAPFDGTISSPGSLKQSRS